MLLLYSPNKLRICVLKREKYKNLELFFQSNFNEKKFIHKFTHTHKKEDFNFQSCVNDFLCIAKCAFLFETISKKKKTKNQSKVHSSPEFWNELLILLSSSPYRVYYIIGYFIDTKQPNDRSSSKFILSYIYFFFINILVSVFLCGKVLNILLLFSTLFFSILSLKRYLHFFFCFNKHQQKKKIQVFFYLRFLWQ